MQAGDRVMLSDAGHAAGLSHFRRPQLNCGVVLSVEKDGLVRIQRGEHGAAKIRLFLPEFWKVVPNGNSSE